jgi:hypothetical protein
MVTGIASSGPSELAKMALLDLIDILSFIFSPGAMRARKNVA